MTAAVIWSCVKVKVKN